jgi:hypothetical protein
VFRLPQRLRTFDNLNLGIVNMRKYLGKIAHVEPLPAPRAFHEVIGFGSGNAVRVNAGLWHSASPCIAAMAVEKGRQLRRVIPKIKRDNPKDHARVGKAALWFYCACSVYRLAQHSPDGLGFPQSWGRFFGCGITLAKASSAPMRAVPQGGN